jgi:PAS domain S-box-containing protein
MRDSSRAGNGLRTGAIKAEAFRYGLALIIVAAATMVRAALDPFIGLQLPFIIYLPAVVFAVWLGGVGPAVFASVLSFLLADYLFLNARHSLAIHGAYNWISLLLYLFACASVIVMSYTLRKARDRARDTARLAAQMDSFVHRLLEGNLFGVALGREDGSIVYANRYFLRMIGFSPEELQQTHLNWDRITPQEWREQSSQLRHELAERGVAKPVERQFMRKDGTRVPVLSGAVSLGPGGPAQIIGFFYDLSELRHTEQQRDQLLESERKARAEAERVSRIKDEFLSTLSHELRTPINAVLGWTHLLRAGVLGVDETEQAMDSIDRNAKSQVQLIDDLLDISRIISGNLRLDVKPVDLGICIDSTVATVAPAADAKSIKIYRHIDDAARFVNGDEARLRQIIWNLLSNAIKFTPTGGRVSVELRANNGQSELVVTDSGRGIDAAFLPFVFDRFQQADSSTTRTFGGLGLGLAIAKHLTELHGGQIRADSAGVGQGACFTVTLPTAPLPQISPVQLEQTVAQA